MLDLITPSDPLELKQLAQSVRRFAEAELRPKEKSDLEFKRSHFSKMAELGLTGMTLEERYGGTDSDCLAIATVNFELARAQLGPAIYLGVHQMVARLVRAWSEPQQNEELMRELATAKKLGAFCLTEAQAGSDAASLRTRAEKKAGDYVINGEKIYITSGGLADVYLVFARTAEDRTHGISAFLLEKNTPGLSFGKPEKKMGGQGSPISSVTFENCRVPEKARLGKEGDGYRMALSGLNASRINIGAAGCGLSSRSLELARAHAKERRQFGEPVANFQGLQFMLAEMLMKLRASVLVVRDAAGQLDRGNNENVWASIAKCYATDRAMEITTDGVQIFGGAGYLEDYEVERLMRDAKMLQIVEGTNQIQRVVIARSLLG